MQQFLQNSNNSLPSWKYDAFFARLVYSYRTNPYNKDLLIKTTLPAVLIAAYVHTKGYNEEFSSSKHPLKEFSADLGEEDTWELKKDWDLIEAAEKEYINYYEQANVKPTKLKLE